MRAGRAGGALLLLLAWLCVPACGAGEPARGPGAAAGDSPVGLWALDAARLLESVRRRYAPEGSDVVAREEAQARLVSLDLQVREDGMFGLKSSALGLTQHIVGTWRAEGALLFFTHKTVDGKPVTAPREEQASLEDGRIVLPFEATGLDFELVRR
ncbi:MAG: hypothetical protein ACKOSS_09265 [Planctomycetia bacterium]